MQKKCINIKNEELGIVQNLPGKIGPGGFSGLIKNLLPG
jgi:hypothetical protein